jgi:catechol 2,3-dioxygenase-like lactoylglutathione lyase family enzyme
MPVHGLDHINLRASGGAFAALRDFYCQVLGLRIGARPPLASAGLWLYAGDAAIVHLVEEPDAGRPAAAAAARGAGGACDHVAFECSGLGDMLGRLERLGVPNAVQTSAVTGQVVIRLEDPSGLCLELVFAPPAGTAPGG